MDIRQEKQKCCRFRDGIFRPANELFWRHDADLISSDLTKAAIIITFAWSRGRFADKAGLAFATMAADQVGADRVGSARSLEALVDIDASRARRGETVPAETLSVQALGVVDAVEIALAVGRDVHLHGQNIVTSSIRQTK